MDIKGGIDWLYYPEGTCPWIVSNPPIPLPPKQWLLVSAAAHEPYTRFFQSNQLPVSPNQIGSPFNTTCSPPTEYNYRVQLDWA